MKYGYWLALALVSGLAHGDVVSVTAETGKAKSDLLIRSGETAVSVNAAATAGTVRLNALNTHTGGTTLNGGRLEVRTVADGVHPADTGLGPLTLLGGIFDYAGPVGGVWTTPVTNAVPGTGAVEWRVDKDLVVDAPVASTSGAFVKTGTGTLTLRQNFVLSGGAKVNDTDRKSLADLSDDRAPTKGYSNVTLFEGTTVIDSPQGNVSSAAITNVLSASGWLLVGGYTTVDGVEKSAILEHRGGVTLTGSGGLNIGSNNGKVGQSGEPPLSGLRVTGGRFIVGSLHTTNSVYMGAKTAGAVQNSHCFLDISSSKCFICKGFNACQDAGSVCDVTVHDGGYLYALNANYTTGASSSSTASTNNLTVTGAGSWISFQNFNNDSKNGGLTTNIRLADGAVMEMRNFSNSSKGKLNLVIDGGVWRHRNNNSSNPHWPSNMTSVKVGPGGVIVYHNGGSDLYPVIWDKGIESLDDSGTDGGLLLVQGSNLPQLLIRAENTYCGPTVIEKIRMELGGNGRLPETTELTIESNNGGLLVSNGVQRVAALNFGYTNNATASSPMLGFAKGSRLDVTGTVRLGTLTAPKLWLFETAGPTDATSNGLSTLGTYTVLTAPASELTTLSTLAGKFNFTYKPATVDYAAYAVLNGERAELRVEVTETGTPASGNTESLLLSTVTGESASATADQLSTARFIKTNPKVTGGGTVEIGAGVESGAHLEAGSGRTEVSDLSFVTQPSDLVIGTGTLAYTGPTATIPGFTVSSGIYSGVLDIPNEETTLSILDYAADSGSLSKMGVGTLHLGGAGEFTLSDDVHNIGSTGGVAANGDGPATTFRAVNVNQGVMSIGTVDDPDDAPTVSAPNDFSVGSQSHRAGSSVQTAGELVMNNGTLLVNGGFSLGYYCGADTAYGTAPLYPTLTQNGGFLRSNWIRLYQDGNTTKTSRACPRLIIHGGTNEVETSLALGYQAAPADHDGRSTVLVDGGLLRVGTYVYNGYANSSMGADFTITGSGRVEMTNAFYAAYKNTTVPCTFRLTNGGTLLSRGITGTDTNCLLNASFDGGVYIPLVSLSENCVLQKIQKAYLGAGGLTFDLSHEAELAGPTDYWLAVAQAFETDPALDGAPDGGLLFTGAGTASLSTGMNLSSFSGGIRVENGARVIAVRALTPESTKVTVKPSGRLSAYYDAPPSTLGSLELGEVGASAPTCLEIVNGQGLCVKGTLSVLSPVALATRSENHDLTVRFDPGVYTALVYNASNADVDLAKFTLPAEAVNRTLSARQETVSGGDYDGYKAVILTIGSTTAGANVWTSATTGGTWGDTANWQAGSVPPNADDAGVTFEPATAVGVPVTLGNEVTLGSLTFGASSGKNGYALSGESLTLGAAGTQAEIDSEGGTNVLSVITLAAADMTRVHAKTGTELRITGSGLVGAGDVTLNANTRNTEGKIFAHVDSSYTGKITTGGGTVEMDDFSFVQAADQLTLGLGTLLYTGPDATVAGLRLKAGSSCAAVFESDADVTVGSLTVSGTSAFLKRGKGTFKVHGTSTFKPNTSVNNGSPNVVAANGDSPQKGLRGLGVATGTFAVGEVGDPENAPTIQTAGYEVTVGAASGTGDAAFVLNNGSVSTTSSFYLSYYGKAGYTYLFQMNGGAFSVSSHLTCGYNYVSAQKVNTAAEINGGRGYVGGNVILGRNNASSPTTQFCRWTQNGGVFGVKGSFYTAYWITNQCPRAFVDLNGGTLAVSNALVFSRSGKNTANNDVRFRLNAGGRLEVNAITQTVASATTCFYGNGGTLAPIGVTAAGGCFGAVGKLYASTNGLVVDTSILAGKDQDYTISLPILHDPDAPAIDGGVVKQGAGLLTLSGANTFTGPLTMAGGTVKLQGSATAPLAELAFTGGTLDAVAPVETGTMTGTGLLMGAVTVTGGLVPEVDAVVNVTGDFTLASMAKIDLTRHPAASLSYGDKIPLVAVLGTANLPSAVAVTAESAPVHVSGQKFRLKISQDADGIVYGTVTSSGTLLLFR